MMNKLTPDRVTAKTAATITATLTLCLLFAQAGMAATGMVNYNTTYQQLEGFGAAGVYDTPSLTSHSQKETLYDLMFRDLGLEFIRIPNCVGYDNTSVTETIIAAARQPGRSPGIKIEMVPWSPPAFCSSGA